MSVYIENIKMPNFGYREIRIYPDGRVIEEDECGIDEVVGTAVPIQQHGKLIDADALAKRIKDEGRNQAEYYADRYAPVVMAYGDCYGKVQSAPTIIPAEKVEA